MLKQVFQAEDATWKQTEFQIVREKGRMTERSNIWINEENFFKKYLYL